jgi:hypothetical protein
MPPSSRHPPVLNRVRSPCQIGVSTANSNRVSLWNQSLVIVGHCLTLNTSHRRCEAGLSIQWMHTELSDPAHSSALASNTL